MCIQVEIEYILRSGKSGGVPFNFEFFSSQSINFLDLFSTKRDPFNMKITLDSLKGSTFW